MRTIFLLVLMLQLALKGDCFQIFCRHSCLKVVAFPSVNIHGGSYKIFWRDKLLDDFKFRTNKFSDKDFSESLSR